MKHIFNWKETKVFYGHILNIIGVVTILAFILTPVIIHIGKALRMWAVFNLNLW